MSNLGLQKAERESNIWNMLAFGKKGGIYLNSNRDATVVRMSVGKIFITSSAIFINAVNHIILGRGGEPTVETLNDGQTRMIKLRVGDGVQIQSVGSRENPRGVETVNIYKNQEEWND